MKRSVYSYTSDELRYFPLNTALYDPPKKMHNTLAKPAGSSESSSDDSSEVRLVVPCYEYVEVKLSVMVEEVVFK